MKKHHFKICILLITVLTMSTSFFGCGPEEPRTDYIDEILKDYCLFQEGSYWVYQSNEGNFDSLYLFQRDNNIVEDDDRNYESIGLQYTSSYYPSDIFGMASAPLARNGSHLAEYWDKNYLTPMGGFFILASDTANKTITALAGTEETYTAYYENLSISDSTYKIVRQYDFNMGNQLSRRTIYWSKGIGRIKYIDADSTVWELIRYEVTQ